MTAGDAGVDAGVEPDPVFSLSGTVAIHPDALDAGLASLVGLTVRVEEPLKVAGNNPAGVFSTATLDATARFSVQNVSNELVNLGVAVGVRDDADAGVPKVVRSATVVYDVLLKGAKPVGEVKDRVAYAIPTAFHDRLTALLTPAKLRMLTPDAPKDTLIGAGCILGKVLDAQGAPVAGVTITPSANSVASRFFYPSADLSSLGTSTSSSGLFLYVHEGTDLVQQFNFRVEGRSEYKQRNAGAVNNACLVVMVTPGS
jgi:hypothetical protein